MVFNLEAHLKVYCSHICCSKVLEELCEEQPVIKNIITERIDNFLKKLIIFI
jgi:hypothetical protein